MQLNPPYESGYKVWEVIIEEYMRVDDWDIPKAFRFQQFYPDQDRTSTSLRMIREATYHVTNAFSSPIASISVPPPLPTKRLNVFDTRPVDPRSDNLISYTIEDGIWRSLEDPDVAKRAALYWTFP